LRHDVDRIEQQFDSWRRYVPLKTAQPTLVTQKGQQSYYLLTFVIVQDDEYQFLLRVYRMQPATCNQTLQLGPGALVRLRFKRSEFAEVQAMVYRDGPAIFNQRPDLLACFGDSDLALAAVLDDHLYLLWHLVTKFREQPTEQQPPQVVAMLEITTSRH
jgi:hypothetical protein